MFQLRLPRICLDILTSPREDLLKKIARRTVLKAGAATVFGAIPLLSACGRMRGRNDPNKLNLYCWADYMAPQTIPQFEERHGVKVIYDTFASNEALLAKLQAGASNYDIIVPSGYMVKQLVKLAILDEIDSTRLIGLSNIMDRFRSPAYDPDLKHSVPYTWGTTGIGYNTAAFGALPLREDRWEVEYNLGLGKLPADWSVLWDRRFAGRITLLDDPRETIGMSLKRLGSSYNTTDEQQISEAVRHLRDQKPLTMCYTSDQVIVQLASGDSWLSQGFSGDVYQAAAQNKDIKYILPIGGASIWTDNFCIPKNAPHKDIAYKWINYMLEPEVAAMTANFTKYATPNFMALDMVAPELRNDKNIYPTPDVLERSEEIADVGSALFIYDRMWTELKCS